MGEEKAKEKKEKYEVEVIRRDIITTFPKLRTPALTSLVTYVAAGLPPDTVSILLSEVAPGKEAELVSQIEAESGPLWEEYLKHEKKLVREAIDKRLKIKPAVYRV